MPWKNVPSSRIVNTSCHSMLKIPWWAVAVYGTWLVKRKLSFQQSSPRISFRLFFLLLLLLFSIYHFLITVICLCLLIYSENCFCRCFHKSKISFMVVLCRLFVEHDSLLFSISLHYRQQASLKVVRCILVRKSIYLKEIDFYNIARVLALYKSYRAAMNKVVIYARPCVNKMTWAFFNLASEFPSC